MIFVDIDECQKGICECGTFTYRRVIVGENSFYLCNKCTETLITTLKLEEQIFNL